MGKPKKFRKILKAAKMGKLHAIYRMGLCYESGRYVEQDLQMAATWMDIAAQHGYGPAQSWLEDYGFDDDPAVQAWA